MLRPGDEELVRRVLCGDRDAAGALFARHSTRAWRAAYRITGDRGLADEALQEGFIRALGHLEGFDRTRPFGPWVSAIVANRARTLIERAAHRRAEPLADDIVGAPGPEPDLRRLGLVSAIGQLNADQRAALLLRDVAGYSTAEAARISRVSEGTIKSRLSRAHRRLRGQLEGEHAEG